MDKIDNYVNRIRNGAVLTQYECLELLEIVTLAALFTEANDRGDGANTAYEDAETDEELAAAGAASDLADEDYNRTKAGMFDAIRKLMGWPDRPNPYRGSVQAG